MAIPQQVKQRSEEANKFFEQQQAQPAQQPEAPAPDDAQRDQEERAREEQAAAEQREAEQRQHDDGVPQSQVEKLGGEEEPNERQQQTDSGTDQKIEKLAQQLSTLQGMMRSTADENQQLRAIIAQMNERPAQTEQTPAPTSSADDSKDKELFGEDFVEMVERRISNRMQGWEGRLSQAEGTAKHSQKVSDEVRQDRFEKRLSERVSDWKEVDSDSDFRQWVSDSNTRVAFIQQAMADYDADAIADIFEQYKALTGKGQQKQEKTAEPAKRSLESKVSPSKGRTSTSAGGAGEKKTWTRSEIAQVFANRRNYPQEEFAELQRDIFAAQKEGRVDYSK